MSSERGKGDGCTRTGLDERRPEGNNFVGVVERDVRNGIGNRDAVLCESGEL